MSRRIKWENVRSWRRVMKKHEMMFDEGSKG